MYKFLKKKAGKLKKNLTKSSWHEIDPVLNDETQAEKVYEFLQTFKEYLKF